jgi:hypothetical protein
MAATAAGRCTWGLRKYRQGWPSFRRTARRPGSPQIVCAVSERAASNTASITRRERTESSRG